MPRIKEWWLRKSRKWKLVIIIVPAIVVFGVGCGVGLSNYFEQPKACATCHIIEPYVASYLKSDLLDYAHAQAEEVVVCSDCHTLTLLEKFGEIVTTMRGDYSDPLEEIKFSRKVCLKCHPAQEIVLLTKDYTVDDEKINPHDSHFGTGNMECRLCHKVHREQVDYCTANCHILGYPPPTSGDAGGRSAEGFPQ